MANKYIDFISDEDFEESVKKVLDAYPQEETSETTLEILTQSPNTVDEFKTVFDIFTKKIEFEEWSKSEIIRQNDKTINNKIGEFHQEILGKVDGWVDLGIGDETEADLKKEDNSIFIELKNKYNTMNSSSTKVCREKLENVIEKYPNATAYWAYIVSKDYKSEEVIWEYHGIKNEKIRRISGDKLYELITGDSNSMKKVFEAIPKAIVNILGEDYKISKKDEKILAEYADYIFK